MPASENTQHSAFIGCRSEKLLPGQAYGADLVALHGVLLGRLKIFDGGHLRNGPHFAILLSIVA